MTMASVTVRADGETKCAAAAIAEDFGLDLLSATRMFYKQTVREHRIIINLSYNDAKTPNADTIAAIEEVRQILKKEQPQFTTADEHLESIE